MIKQDNLTAKQQDYAIFLPALSSFFAGYIGRQRHSNYIDPSRMPKGIPDMEMLNWFNSQKGLYHYKWSLYSAGHANLDVNKFDIKEDMVRNRDPNTFLLGDSGGFQIGKGVWEGDWKNPLCPKAKKKREQVLSWMDAYMDRGMVLDIPAWVCRSEAGRAATGITSYQQAVEGTRINNDYFIHNRTGSCKFLNVLQGENHTEADDWYQQMKDYCDPKKYSRPFEGWAMGGQNMCDVHLVLRRLVYLIHDGLLEQGLHDWMHFLGTSKLEWACLLTDIQRAVRRYHNPDFTISFDCASPFLATANGQIYVNKEITTNSKWVYRMEPTADDKKFATDSRSFRDAVLAEGIHKKFLDSPVSSNLAINDICIYKPGDLNKLGKEGTTSWDSFSYALMMCHNVWSHIDAVQSANAAYAKGKMPAMLRQSNFEIVKFTDIVNEIFSQKNLQKSLAIIDRHDKFWQSIPGTRGNIGVKTLNNSTSFNRNFEIVEVDPQDETNLRLLEAEQNELQ